MTLTNGPDQSVTIQRERGRQGLEQGRGKSRLPIFKSEERRPARPQSTADIAFARTLVWHEGTLLLQSAWNVGVQDMPETERRDYSADIPVIAVISVRSRQKLTGLAEGYKNVCERWSLDALRMAKLLHLEEEIGLCDLILFGQALPMTGDLKDRMALVIGISIGLGELFDDDKGGELQWLNSTRSDLGDVSPLEHMLKGDLLNIRDVVDLVDNARGLK